MKSTIFFAAGLLSTALVAGALAHGGATGIVKKRMDGMTAMGDVVKSLSAMMRSETPYDAATVRQGASTIRAHAGEAMTGLFPEGSGGMPSEARPEIWTDWEEFAALANRLDVLAEGLAEAAGNDPAMSQASRGTSDMMGASNGGMMGNGASTMMGTGGVSPMGENMMGADTSMLETAALAKMPPDGVFNMVAQTCSACHTKFRIEKN